jgi:hypothetical protein
MADICNFVSALTQAYEDFNVVDNVAQIDNDTPANYSVDDGGLPADWPRIIRFTGHASRGALSHDLVATNHTFDDTNHLIDEFYMRWTDTTPGTEYTFWGADISGDSLLTGNPRLSLVLEADGDIRLQETALGDVATATAPLSDNTWHRFRIRYLSGTTGNVQVWVDGTDIFGGSQSTDSSQPVAGVSHGGPLADGGTSYYTGSVNHFNSTASTDGIDADFEIIGPYQGDAVASATPDVGETTGVPANDDLDSGTWATAQEIPFDDETDAASATYENALQGGIFTDGTTRAGPSGDSRVDGDSNIKAWKHLFRADRGTGGGVTHRMWTGNDSDDIVNDGISLDITVGTSPTNFYFVTDVSTSMPTSSQNFMLGMGKTGTSRHLQLREMAGFVLHVPAAEAGVPELTMATRIPT